jgi:hypothetical protein
MSRRTVAATAIAIGGLLLTPQVLPASATTPGSADGVASVALAAAQPPEGKAWLVGVVTDQAGHTLDGVNVEAWPTDPGATEPIASSLTYDSIRNDGQHGFFNLEVPIHSTYLIVISRPTGDLDDGFRTFQYNDGKPIKVGLRKERKLGTAEIARTALQKSATKATLGPATVKLGKQAKITVTVTCKNVDPVLGKVTAAVGGKKVAGTLKQTSRGRITLTLPKLTKPGKYTVEAWYLGDSYTKKSTKKLTLTVKK